MLGALPKVTECPGCGALISGTPVYECKTCGTFSCSKCGQTDDACKECKVNSVVEVAIIK